MVPEEKNPVDQVLDLVVFAPLGLAMTARTQLPEMVAKGRSQVENQLTMARFIGQFAVKQGKGELEKRVKAYTDRPPPGEAGPTSAEADAEPEPEHAVDVTLLAGVPAVEGRWQLAGRHRSGCGDRHGRQCAAKE